MNLLYIYLTYNRPKVLGECLRTSLGNTQYPIDKAYILDDGSDLQIQNDLFKFVAQNRNVFPIDLLIRQKNEGISLAFETAYNLMRIHNPVVCAFVESDYVWRKGYLEDIMAVFESSPHTVAIAGTDHKDMYDRQKTHELFPKLMMEQFPKDVDSRQFMYIPFDLETSRGKIKVQGVSNSCGCMFLHWERFSKMIEELGVVQEYWEWMDRAFNKQPGGNRKYASDQHMSCSVSWYYEQWAKKNNIDISKHFGFLNIADYAISSHKCGMGVNGMIVPEGVGFVDGRAWNEKYLEIDPRL